METSSVTLSMMERMQEVPHPLECTSPPQECAGRPARARGAAGPGRAGGAACTGRRSMAHTVSCVTSGRGAASLLCVAAPIACKEASLLKVFSCPWTSPATFDTRRDMERVRFRRGLASGVAHGPRALRLLPPVGVQTLCQTPRAAGVRVCSHGCQPRPDAVRGACVARGPWRKRVSHAPRRARPCASGRARCRQVGTRLCRKSPKTGKLRLARS